MKKTLTAIYKTLLQEYGPQGWWPIINNKTLLCEYHTGAPRNEEEQFEIICGAILTQNTAWSNVEKALNELKKNKSISLNAILQTKKETIAGYIKSSGYNNQKAERLKLVAQFLVQYPIEELQAMEVKPLRNLLLSVKGIGPETADSIILYAFNKPSFVVDAYTKRIMERLGITQKQATYDEIQELITWNIEQDPKLYNEYHALFVEHAKVSCRIKPICHTCVLNKMCEQIINII